MCQNSSLALPEDGCSDLAGRSGREKAFNQKRGTVDQCYVMDARITVLVDGGQSRQEQSEESLIDQGPVFVV